MSLFSSPPPFSSKDKAVLITGCSSGIGRATALHLASQGFTVFATVRKEADAADLRALNEPNLVPICPLDLAHREQIPPVIERVANEIEQRGLKGLYALINNAGSGSVAPIELMDVDAFHTELQARLVGPVAMLQAFLPLIRQSQGRIIWIVTPGLIITPFVASIHASDFAANCLARTLNIELKKWRIPNILVRCGGIQTAAPNKTDRALEADFCAWPSERFELYAQSLRKTRQEFVEFDKKRTDTFEVAKVVCQALSARRPHLRYQVGYLSGLAAFLELLPGEFADRLIASRN